MAEFDVVGMGALNVDRVFTVPRIISDGAELVTAAAVDAGGCAANTAYALARLGLRCGFVGAVGDDPDAEIVLGSFARVGVDTGGIVRKSGAPTGNVFILADGAGNRAMYVRSGANALFTAEDVDPSYLARSRLLHLSSFNGELPLAAQAAILAALPGGTLVALSVDSLYARRGLAAMRGFIARSDVVFANAAELREMTGHDLPSAARAILDEGCRSLVVTFGGGQRPGWLAKVPGAGGGDVACYIASGEGEWAVPAPRTFEGPLVDATGAGDAFAAGFIFGLLAGWPLPRCGSLGHTLAGFCLAALGCRGGIPSRVELLERHARYFPP